MALNDHTSLRQRTNAVKRAANRSEAESPGVGAIAVKSFHLDIPLACGGITSAQSMMPGCAVS